ncbi:MAG: outer membrane beta-barrel protein [Putridiphycobacter sp.]|nr:outer membrane beta-barrel protein [Putridiphycobacter sp.]
MLRKLFIHYSSILLISLFTIKNNAYSQVVESKTQFGGQFKPILPNRFIGEYIKPFQSELNTSFTGSVQQKFGYSAGFIIRHKFSNIFTVESGINFVKRNYHFNYALIDSGIVAESNVSFISYDIPINGLVYVRIAEQWYMNASAGINFNFYPTSVNSQNEDFFNDHLFRQITSPRRRVQLGLNINYGFDYRIKDVGTFYLGASYLLPFSDIAVHQMSWIYKGSDLRVRENVNGSYFTLDFKYFFPQ